MPTQFDPSPVATPRSAPSKRRVADALGEIDVDASVLWGAQTQRAVQHFDIGGEPMPIELMRALVSLKGVAATVNGRLGLLPEAMAQAIATAAEALLADAPEKHFPLSQWQSGSGTQSHMNVNEVLARLAELQLAQHGGDAVVVHPNDHVNVGQSSNDMVPSAMHVASVLALHARLLPALHGLAASLQAQAQRHTGIVKLGRTHLQDAVPMTLGQEIGAWHHQLTAARNSIDQALPALHALAVGGTAVGTGLNTHPDFGRQVCDELARRTSQPWVPAADRFAALAGHEPLVALHSALKLLAVVLVKIGNDLRLLASGPRGGLGEVQLPANEPGSSIMPGKVNPTQCEALVMVAYQVMGNDLAVTLGAAGGHLQLNTHKPLIVANVLRSIRLLADAMTAFDRYTVQGMAPDAVRIDRWLQASLMHVTALSPHVGYNRAAAIAHHALAEGSTLRDAALALGMAGEDFDRWVNLRQMASPHEFGAAAASL